MPEVAPPESLPPLPRRTDGTELPMRGRYEQRWAIGAPPFSGAPEALAGGWIRFAEPRVADALLVAALTDAWPPALFTVAQPGTAIGAVPTVDLNVHFRVSLPLAQAKPEDWLLAVFRVREAREGFFEEDGEIWSRDGVLLAQSRQLGVLM
jgi:acyl-CoA thioesterase